MTECREYMKVVFCEFQVDAFDTAEESNEFMCGPVNAANPVGVEYDPEDWLAQIRGGTPASDLLNRQVHEPLSPIRGVLAPLIEHFRHKVCFVATF